MRIVLTDIYTVERWTQFEPDEKSLKVINKLLYDKVVEKDKIPTIDAEFLNTLFTHIGGLGGEICSLEVHEDNPWGREHPRLFTRVVEETVKEFMWDFLDWDDESWDCEESYIEVE